MKPRACLLLATLLVLPACVPPGTGGTRGSSFALNTKGAWQPPPGAQPAPSSAQPGNYDYSGIARMTVDGQPATALDVLNVANTRNALTVGQIVPTASPIPRRLRIVLPDHDRLRLLALQMTRGVPGGIVEMQAELQRLNLHEIADAVQRSQVFASTQIDEENDTASPEPQGADDLLWYQVQSMRPNNAGPWVGAWQMRRANGAATLAVTMDPGTAPGPPRLMSFVKSVRDVSAALGAGAPGLVQGAPLGTRRAGHPFSGGSGIVIDGRGHVLTDNHVIANCLDVRVTGAGGGTPTGATLIANDAPADLALLQTSQRWTAHARFRPSNGVRPGESVVVTGFPLTGLVSPEMAVTTGSVTALSGGQGNDKLIQFSAPIQPGNSGGPLLDDTGRVVGIATSEINALALAMLTGGALPQNVNFATKTDVVGRFLSPLQISLDEAAGGGAIDPASVGDLARGFTIKVECWK